MSRAEDGENARHFGTESETVPRAEGAEGVEKTMLTKQAVPKLCCRFAETSLQRMSRKGRPRVKKIIRIPFGYVSEASELCHPHLSSDELEPSFS